MKRKRLVTLIGSVCLVLVLAALSFMAACPAPVEEPLPPTDGEEPLPPEAWEWPAYIVLTSPGLGTSQYVLTVAWGSVLENQTGMSVRIVPQDTVVRHISQKVGMSTITTNEPLSAKQGLEATTGYETRDGGPFQMRVFWNSNIAPWGFVVRDDSGIYTPQDLKGARIANLVTAPFIKVAIDCMLALAGLDESDVTLVPMSSYPDQARAVAEGKVDTCFLSPVSAVTFEISGTPGGIRWIPIPTKEEDPEGIARWLSGNPIEFFAPCQIGVESAMGVNMVVQPQFYMTSAEIDPELIYHLAKWMDESYEDYRGKYLTCELLDIDTFKRLVVDMSFIPIHEGVVRYLKEKGLWTAENESRQEKYTALVDQYVEAYEDAIKMADEKGIEVDPENEEWVQLWTDYKKELNLEPFAP
ncbi:MAG: TAXI family TRAP transporter solute-binding subunit [Desulfobacterales bacterium]|nr:TAXI family TRAP transporter solute-binding subunit [Desulfobacterales bacterium]